VIKNLSRNNRVLSTRGVRPGLFKYNLLELGGSFGRIFRKDVALGLLAHVRVSCGAADPDSVGVVLGHDLIHLLRWDVLSQRLK